jgi:hypothetical protein
MKKRSVAKTPAASLTIPASQIEYCQAITVPLCVFAGPHKKPRPAAGLRFII